VDSGGKRHKLIVTSITESKPQIKEDILNYDVLKRLSLMNYKLFISPGYSNSNLQEVAIEREVTPGSSGIIYTINEIYNYLSANSEN
jgi:hypothetical protein